VYLVFISILLFDCAVMGDPLHSATQRHVRGKQRMRVLARNFSRTR